MVGFRCKLITALNEKTSSSYDNASKRLGVILDAYTVYHDLVLCDMMGNAITNGRPLKHSQIINSHLIKQILKLVMMENMPVDLFIKVML